MQQTKLQGKPAPPDTKSWFEYSWKLKQDVPNRYEDAAKFLATIISLTITIIFASYEKLQLIVFHPLALFVVLTLWLVALFFAFMVLFPHDYSYHSKSIQSIKDAQDKIIKTKKNRFLCATILYFVPLFLLVLLYLISIIQNLQPVVEKI